MGRLLITPGLKAHICKGYPTIWSLSCTQAFASLEQLGTEGSYIQRLQNSTARVIFAVSRRVDASPLLEALHWLPVSSQITFKILLYVFKILNGQATRYLTELFSYYKPTRCLRSSSDTTRLVLHSSATAICDKRFQIVAAKSWNLLPLKLELSFLL